MSEEEAFLAAIASQPDEDAPRLALADWLDEHDRPDEAEFIRVQIELEPLRERYGEPRTEELYERSQKLSWPQESAAREWFRELGCERAADIEINSRRGFIEELHLPVQWVIEHGAAIRERFPLLRKLVAFRLNGWGERFAACPHLQGLRELDLGCWYSDADCTAIAFSPHLADLEVLTYWGGGIQWDCNPTQQLGTLAGSTAWPNLRTLRVMLADEDDRFQGNAAAGRPLVEAIIPRYWLYPFRPDFGGGFFIGKLPDGTQMFACDADEDGIATAVLFNADGDEIKRRKIEFPPRMRTTRENKPPKGDPARDNWQEAQREKRLQSLRDTLGFEPAFIRVQQFSIGSIGPHRDRNSEEGGPGMTDDPNLSPDDDHDGALGAGRSAYNWYATKSFVFMCGNEWWCDGTGRVTST